MSGINSFHPDDARDDFGDFEDAFDAELEPIDDAPTKSLVELHQERSPKALVVSEDDYVVDWTDPDESPLYRDERNLAILSAKEGFEITPIGIHEPREIPVSFIAIKRSEGLAVVVTLTNPDGRSRAAKARLGDLNSAERSSLPIFAAACLAAEGVEGPFRYVFSMHAYIRHYWKNMPTKVRARQTRIGSYFQLLDTLPTHVISDGLIKVNNEMLSDAFLPQMKSKEYKELSLGKLSLPPTLPKACHCEEDKRFRDK